MQKTTQTMTQTAMQTTETIKTFARKIGFDLVRIIDATPIPHLPAAYEKWLAEGQAADMDYLKKDPPRRLDPQKILPGARSVIMLGINYYKKEHIFGEGFHIAKYAQSRDYHKVITSLLKRLAAYITHVTRITETANAHTASPATLPAIEKTILRHAVDFGPLLERAYGAKARLGFIGKNTCIITREYGSYIFLAELITTLELTPDPPTAWQGSCGTCTRCITACPTNAILPDRTIDSRRCISYLTIENRGPIPEEFRKKIGTWLFGCDICQDICPHNVRAKPAALHDLKTPSRHINPKNLTLKKILSIETDEKYHALFAGTPLMRAHRRGLIRNACIVAGNFMEKNLKKNPRLCATLRRSLEKLASSSDPMLAEHANWALQKATLPKTTLHKALLHKATHRKTLHRKTTHGHRL